MPLKTLLLTQDGTAFSLLRHCGFNRVASRKPKLLPFFSGRAPFGKSLGRFQTAGSCLCNHTLLNASTGNLPEWGVTVLQADEDMDAGDVWNSNNFAVPHSSTLTKSAFYNKVKRGQQASNSFAV